MKYKVGDQVKVRSLDWYNANKDEYGNVDINYYFTFYADRSKYCGKVFTISKVFDNSYLVKEDNGDYYWTDEMIEGLAEEEVGLVDRFSSRWVNEFSLPDGYIFKDENGNVINAHKIVLEKKKKEYPKTYEECEKILGLEDSMIEGCFGYEYKLLNAFQKLLMCRDAYWKIAGEEMGLGKPWEPDWKKQDKKYIISVFEDTVIYFENETYNRNTILSFPTAKMLDVFYENFNELIEECKDFL